MATRVFALDACVSRPVARQTSPTFAILILSCLLLIGALGVPSLLAQDALTVGGGTCVTGYPGSVAHVPVYIVDKSGTPLGSDQGTGKRIEAFAFQVAPSPTTAIALNAGRLAAVGTQSGITAAYSATTSSTATTATTFGYLAFFDEATAPLPFTLNAAAPGNKVADVALTLSGTAAIGSSISLPVTTSPSVTALYNTAGTTSETVGSNLSVTGGCINVQALTIALNCPPVTIIAGTTGPATVSIGAAESTDTTVTLTSSNPSAATVPSAVVITAGQTAATFQVTGVSAGTASIVATLPAALGGASASCTSTVANPTISIGLTCPASPVTAGSSGTATATIGAVQGSPTVVTLSSSNAAAATVASSVTIPAGQTSATFAVTGVAAGSSTITATMPSGLGGQSATCTTIVVNPTIGISLSCPAASIMAGTTGTATVSIASAQSSATTVSLSSSNTAVATVPSTVTIGSGLTSASFTVTGVGAGTATLSATMPAALGGLSSSCATTISPTVTPTLACPSGSVTTGTNGTATIAISAAQASATNVTLLSSNTSTATVPASVSIAAGQTSASFQVYGAAAGTATITATLPAALGGKSTTCTTTVANPTATVSLACPSTDVVVGATGSGTVFIGTAQATDTTITLSSSSTSTATVPASVVIPSGKTSVAFQLTGVAAGTSTITATVPASLGGASASCTARVVNPPVKVSLQCPAANIVTGSSATAKVALASAQGSQIGITLTSGNVQVATVPPTAIIAAGQTAGSFDVRGIGAGSTTITATAPSTIGGLSASCNATVVDPTISLTPATASVAVGVPASLTLTISAPPAGAISVALASSNTAAVTVPASVTIAAGASSASIPLTGGGSGFATITATLPASLGGGTATAQVTVTSAIAYFRASPAGISLGKKSTLSWSTVGTSSVTIDNGIGSQNSIGTVVVAPTKTTTYTLTTVVGNTSVTASVKVDIVAEPVLVISAFPSGMVQTPTRPTATDSFSLTNIGGATASISLTQDVGFFTQSPATFTLAPGSTQAVAISAPPQTTKFVSGKSLIAINGVSSGLSVPVRLMFITPPSGSVNATAAQNEIDVSSNDPQPTGAIVFTNSGSATLEGIVVSDAPWLIPESGIITIEPGKSRSVTFTIDRSKRTDGSAPTGSIGARLSLVYSGNASQKMALPYGTTPTAPSVTSVAVVDTPKATVSVSTIPPIPTGQIAFLIPGVRQLAGVTSTFLLQHHVQGGFPRDLGIFYTSAASSTSQLASLSSVSPRPSISFSDVVRSVFGSQGEAGGLQVRTSDCDKVDVGGRLMNVSNPAGLYGTTLTAFRSDRGATAARSIHLNGIRKDAASHTDIYLQEVAGQTVKVQTDFFDEKGVRLSSRSDDLKAFGVVEIENLVPQGAVRAAMTSDANSQGSFVARALVMDESTGAPADVIDWRMQNGISASDTLLIPLVTTRHGTRGEVHTEVLIANPGPTAVSGTLQLPTKSSRNRAVRTSAADDLRAETNGSLGVSIDPLQSWRIPDVLSSLGVSGDSSGYVTFTPTAGTPYISAQLRGSNGSGTFATSIPVVALSSGLTLSQSRIFAEIEDAAPSDTTAGKGGTVTSGFGLIETAGQAVTVRVTLHFTAGGVADLVTLRAVVSKDYVLTPRQSQVFSSMPRELIGDIRDTFRELHDMQIDFTVVGGTGAVIPYVVSTDNGTGQAIFRLE